MTHFYLRITPADKAKVIISVSKKVSKKAVTRNTIKRLVRAVMRSLIKKLKPGTYMIVAKPGSDKIKSKEIEEELKTLFKL